MKYIPDKHEHIVHVYRRDDPDGAQRALCGWRPPGTWHPKNGPAPLTALPDCERCPRCLDQIAREPDELYALMPPEDWIDWEGEAVLEQDLSGDPSATGPRDSEAESAAAKADAKAQRPWSKKKWWALSGLILLVIAVAVAAVASGGSDNSSSTASDSGAANSAASANKAASKAPKPASPPTSSGPTGGLPLQDGGWRLDSITVESNSRGDFAGSAGIVYTGGNPGGEDNIFTVTLFKGGREVGALQGRANAVTRMHAATVRLTSSDRWVAGPYTYDFQSGR